jgi:hypothetical protein
MKQRAERTTGKAASRARRSDVLQRTARLGLVARGIFYLLLAGLSARLAFAGGGQQADANGALGTVVAQPLGKVGVAAAAGGLLAFAMARLIAAVAAALKRDRDGWWPAVRAAGETVAYAAIAAFTISFLLGNHSGGSEQSHRSMTAKLLEAPAGRYAIAAIGVAIVAFYGYQAWVALTQEFESGLDEHRMPRWLRKTATIAGTAGIAARVIAFAPIGVFLLVAAVTYDPNKAKGLDGMLRDAADHWWGIAVLALVSCGFAAFAVYSFLEAAYRKVDKA